MECQEFICHWLTCDSQCGMMVASLRWDEDKWLQTVHGNWVLDLMKHFWVLSRSWYLHDWTYLYLLFFFQIIWRIFRRWCRNAWQSYSGSSRLSSANTRPSTLWTSWEQLERSLPRSKVSNYSLACMDAHRHTRKHIQVPRWWSNILAWNLIVALQVQVKGLRQSLKLVWEMSCRDIL